MTKAVEIEFDFEVVQVKSLVDGSPRVVIGLSEGDMPKAMLLWDAKLRGEAPHAVITFGQPDSRREAGKGRVRRD